MTLVDLTELCYVAGMITLVLVLILSFYSNDLISASHSTGRSIVSSLQHPNNTIFVSIVSGDYNPFRLPISQDLSQVCEEKSSSYYRCSSNYLTQLKTALENENPSPYRLPNQQLNLGNMYDTERNTANSSSHEYPSPTLSQLISTNDRIRSEITQICDKPSLSYYSCANAYYNGLLKKMQEQPSPWIFAKSSGNNISSFNLPFHDPPSYNPSSLTVKIGTTIEWTNHDNKIHTVTSGTNDEGPTGFFDSNNLDLGQSYKYTFNKPGIFPYFDKVSKTMSGTIFVVK